MTPPEIKYLGIQPYAEVHANMLDFTLAREPDSDDQIWVLEHTPVYTQGTSCRDTPTPNRQQIRVIKTDRGGQITYHGPGQLIVYLLLDMKRLGLGPRALVNRIESALITTLAELSISAERKEGAPGVFVDGRKIAALGLRIKKGHCYHGLSLNIDMDLSPYKDIDPCGYAGLEVIQVADFIPKPALPAISHSLLGHLIEEIQA